MRSAKRLGVLAAAVAAVAAMPASAGAQASGTDCGYTTTSQAGVTDGTAGIQAGGGGMPGDATLAVGACLNGPAGGGSLEVGTGSGSYAVIDGDADNPDPGDGYMGLSSYENGSSSDDDCSDGPDQGDNPSTNSGGCFGADGGAQLDLTDLRDLGIPTPICGNTSGGSWNSTPRDGCSNP